jgi:hypothetical protein
VFGFLKRRHPEPPEPIQGVGVWTAADLFGLSEPKSEHVVTPTGQHGTYLHSFKAAKQTAEDRERAEAAALAESNRALSPGMRLPTTQPRQSPFSTTPNPDSFPS